MLDVKSLERHLDALYEKKKYPGVSLCMRGPEGIIFEKAYGYADMEKTRPITPETIFGIASMSKSMATLACAMLQVEGKLNFSDPISKYFPELKIPGTPQEALTLRHVAMHTMGLPPNALLSWSIVINTPPHDPDAPSELRDTAPSKVDTIDDIIDYISHSGAYEPLGAPGEYMSYSNEGYALLSYVVDQASGIPLEEFLEERIFKPLSMQRTVLDLDGSKAISIANGDITDLFNTEEDGTLYSDQRWSVLPPYRACACAKSTARDMTRYYQMISQHGIFEGRQIVEPEVIEIMIGREFPETLEPFYCFGLNKRLFSDRIICEHSGGLHGVSSRGGMLLDEGYSFTVLCNQSSVDVEPFMLPMYNLICGVALDTSHTFAIPSGKIFSEPEALVGTYISEEDRPVYRNIVRQGNNGELYATYQGEEVKLLFCEETLFSARSLKDPDEQVTTMRFLIRDGKAWGVQCYTRIYQREKAE